MKKDIAIISVDSIEMNLALMKVAGYYGDRVEWFIPFKDYTDVYASKIFNNTPDYAYMPEGAIKGGAGYDIYVKLPPDIDESQPNYSIYPNAEYSIQRYSRGCIRKCKFCVVHKMDGKIRPVDPMNWNPNDKFVWVFDDNFFASPAWEESIQHLLGHGKPVHFEGVDVRILTEEMMQYLNQLRLHRQIHIAWDTPSKYILEKIKKLITIVPPRKLMCYVLIGFGTTFEEDMYRVMTLKELGVDPYVMPYNEDDLAQRKFRNWVNYKPYFKSVKWEDFKWKTWKAKKEDLNTIKLF